MFFIDKSALTLYSYLILDNLREADDNEKCGFINTILWISLKRIGA